MISESRKTKAHLDIPLILLTIPLAIFGVFAIATATYGVTSEAEASMLNRIVNSPYSMRQAIFLLISPVIITVMTIVPLGFVKKNTSLFYVMSIIILLVVVVTNGAEGVKAWVDIIWGYTIQPSEFAKITLILMLAKMLSQSASPLSTPKEFISAMVIVALPSIAIMLQGEMGTLIVFVFVVAVMFFFSGVKFKILGGLAAAGIAAIAAITFIAVASGGDNYRLTRILAYWNPEQYSQSGAYQQTQSMLAIGSGGMQGIGMFVDGAIYQLDYVPADWTDFIFATIGEAFGFVGCAAIVVIYLLLILRMLYLAAYTKDKYSQLVIIGVMSMFMYHIFQNIGMTIGLMPITGIPLPFLSYGGSNMVSNMACIGIVLNVTMNRSLSQSISTPQTSMRGRYFGQE